MRSGLTLNATADLRHALQARWDDSLRERATIDLHSPIPMLDNLLAPYRGC